MEKRFIDKVEDNATVRIWSEKTQQEKGDNLTEGYISYSTEIMVICLIYSMSKWISTYSELLPSIGILPIAALFLGRIQVDKAYSRATNVSTFLKRLMSITGMRVVIFPKVLGYIDKIVSYLFDRLDKRVTPVPVILAETFRFLSACRRAGEERFIGYSPLKEFVATPRRDNISEEKWMTILQSLQDEDVEWKAPWMIPDEILSRQFILATQGLAQCEFMYKGDNYKKKAREISNAWNQIHRMKGFAANPMTTPKYNWWWGKRVNDNVPMSSQENIRPIAKHLQKLEAEKMIKGKNKVEEDLGSLKTYYKKLRLSMRTVGRNSAIELKASLNKIEELKGKIEKLKTALQNCELRVEFLETNNEHYKEQLQRSQGQIRDRDHIMDKAVTQVREVADHLQTLVVRADILSLKYESKSNQGRELA
ncbi:hypothetical protein Gogos_020672 [Gossypium gossypioides]|uniref:Aminotransferase-like plant mobile domain-containing protein n=1 Tax=Gossypium gossypioides TaxID=34282 RepID=A0A7J9D7A1_GOSGO|nr:hypothetical protein [Gossypium gossypioides]